MPTTPIHTFDCDVLQPFYRPERALAQPVRLPASVTYPKGTILGEVIGNNEVQTLTIDATGGTFTATFSGQTTAALAYNLRASALQAALEALSSIGSGNVKVTQPKRLYTLTVTAGGDAGTFHIKVRYKGEEFTTTALTFDESKADIDAAIEALPHLPDNAVTVGGTDTTGPWTLTFSNALVGPLEVEIVQDSVIDNPVWEGGIVLTEGLHPYVVEFQNDLGLQNVAAMTTDATSLTGGGQTATVATLTAGAAGTAGLFRQVDLTGTDGRQFPRAVLQYAASTDSDGNITVGGGEHGEHADSAPAWFAGFFHTTDIPDLTQAILDAWPGAKLVSGSIDPGNRPRADDLETSLLRSNGTCPRLLIRPARPCGKSSRTCCRA
jgi:hypothetical protein